MDQYEKTNSQIEKQEKRKSNSPNMKYKWQWTYKKLFNLISNQKNAN